MINKKKLLAELQAELDEWENHEWHEFSRFRKAFAMGIMHAMLFVRAQPTVDTKPVETGRWILRQGSLMPVYKCSICGISTITGKTNFCPHCGNPMK